MSASNSSHCWRIPAASSGERASAGECGKALNLSSWRRVRSMNARPSAKVMVAVVSEKPRTVERDITTSPLEGAFCRLFDVPGYYRKHPFQAMRFGGLDGPDVGPETAVSGPLVEALFRSISKGRLRLSEASKAQQAGCRRIAERSHFNKTFASLNASCVILGKGRNAVRFVPFKTPLRRCQSRPKQRFGVTYAESFFTALRCTNSGFLLVFACVARGKSCKVGSPCYE